MKVIVLESPETKNAIGLMNATTLFDGEFLNREYDLRAFNYLQKHETGKLTNPGGLTSEELSTSKIIHDNLSTRAFMEDVDPISGKKFHADMSIILFI